MKAGEVATTIARGTTFLFALEVLVFACGFLNKVVLARWLTPAEVGVIALVSSWTGLAAIVFLFGFHGSVTKYVAEYASKGLDSGPLFSTALKVVLVLSAAGAIVVFLTADIMATAIFHTPEAALPFRVGAAIVFFTMIYRLVSQGLMGLQRMGWYTLAESAYSVTLLGATVGLLWLGYGLMGAIWAMVIPVVIAASIAYALMARGAGIDLSPSIDRGIASRLAAFSIPFYATVVIEMALGLADTFMIGYLTDAEQVGFYSVAIWLMGMIVLLSRPLNTVLFPAFSSIFARGDHDGLREVFNRSLKYSAYLLLPAAAGVIVLAEPLVVLFFEPKFAPAVLPLRILAVAAVFSALRALGTKFISAIGEPKALVRYVVAVMAIDIVLNYFFIQWYGIAGAAVATTIALALFMALCFIHVARGGLKISLSFLPACLTACAAMAAAVWAFMSFVRLPSLVVYGNDIMPYVGLLAGVVLGIAIYAVTLYLLKGFDKNDMELAGRMARGLKSRLKAARPR
jgi:O-antigen/teichoic acid export membrane protein